MSSKSPKLKYIRSYSELKPIQNFRRLKFDDNEVEALAALHSLAASGGFLPLQVGLRKRAAVPVGARITASLPHFASTFRFAKNEQLMLH